MVIVAMDLPRHSCKAKRMLRPLSQISLIRALWCQKSVLSAKGPLPLQCSLHPCPSTPPRVCCVTLCRANRQPGSTEWALERRRWCVVTRASTRSWRGSWRGSRAHRWAPCAARSAACRQDLMARTLQHMWQCAAWLPWQENTRRGQQVKWVLGKAGGKAGRPGRLVGSCHLGRCQSHLRGRRARKESGKEESEAVEGRWI